MMSAISELAKSRSFWGGIVVVFFAVSRISVFFMPVGRRTTGFFAAGAIAPNSLVDSAPLLVVLWQWERDGGGKKVDGTAVRRRFGFSCPRMRESRSRDACRFRLVLGRSPISVKRTSKACNSEDDQELCGSLKSFVRRWSTVPITRKSFARVCIDRFS